MLFVAAMSNPTIGGELYFKRVHSPIIMLRVRKGRGRYVTHGGWSSYVVMPRIRTPRNHINCINCGARMTKNGHNHIRCAGCVKTYRNRAGPRWGLIPRPCHRCGQLMVHAHCNKRFCNDCRRVMYRGNQEEYRKYYYQAAKQDPVKWQRKLQQARDYRARMARDPIRHAHDRAYKRSWANQRLAQLRLWQNNPELLEQAVRDKLKQMIGEQYELE